MDKVIQVCPIIDLSVRDLCRKPYPGHPRGCPNYAQRRSCPPLASTFPQLIRTDRPIYAAVNDFPIDLHAAKMRQRHPGWTERQVYNCLYWQPQARRQLREIVDTFLETQPRLVAIYTPEATGIDVTSTLASVGIQLEWPPRIVARQVAILGSRRSNHSGFDCPAKAVN